jgi:hypothetical protein
MHTWGAWAFVAKFFVLFNLVCQVSASERHIVSWLTAPHITVVLRSLGCDFFCFQMQLTRSLISSLGSTHKPNTHARACLTHDATHTDHSRGGTAHSDGGQQDQEDLHRMSRGRHVCSDDCVHGVVEHTLLHAQLCGWWSAHFAVSFCLRAFACVCSPLLFSYFIYIRSCAHVR